jgi:hypothetical protein
VRIIRGIYDHRFEPLGRQPKKLAMPYETAQPLNFVPKATFKLPGLEERQPVEACWRLSQLRPAF